MESPLFHCSIPEYQFGVFQAFFFILAHTHVKIETHIQKQDIIYIMFYPAIITATLSCQSIQIKYINFNNCIMLHSNKACVFCAFCLFLLFYLHNSISIPLLSIGSYSSVFNEYFMCFCRTAITVLYTCILSVYLLQNSFSFTFFP